MWASLMRKYSQLTRVHRSSGFLPVLVPIVENCSKFEELSISCHPMHIILLYLFPFSKGI